jgi:hypothetical protein
VRIWRRLHSNDIEAEVRSTFVGKDEYLYEARARTAMTTIHTVGHQPGFEEAKTKADEVSSCPQPCTCPPWDEVVTRSVWQSVATTRPAMSRQ